MDLGLKDKIVFVAGSSRGIGLGIAKAFLGEGARVVLTGRQPGPLAAAVRELAAGGDDARILPVSGDLLSREGVMTALRQVESSWGAPHCVVANIGSGAAKPGWQLGSAEWNEVFAVNFWSSVHLAEAVLPRMVERKEGCILFVSSIVGVEAVRAPLAYSAAKAALLNYSKNLSRLVAEHGIRVNSLAPGNVLAPGGAWESKQQIAPAKVQAYIDAEVPLRRFGRPDEIGSLATYLCSPAAGFVTGSCFIADGGQTRSI